MGSVPSRVDVRPRERSPFARYRQALWLLTKRDLRVRYATSALGYVWSILDPLLMSGIYYFVFVIVFHRQGIGEDPYIVFLLAALLPWVWFNGSVSDSARAFLREAKLIRSTRIPRTIWVNRIVLSKGIEFVLSLPVLAVFAVIAGAHLSVDVLLFPLGVLLQLILTIGVGLIVAPLVVFFRDLDRAIKLVLRLLFYASPIVYGAQAVPHGIRHLMAINPLTGIFSLYRSAFFPSQLVWSSVAISAVVSFVMLAVGIAVFRRAERPVLKEL